MPSENNSLDLKRIIEVAASTKKALFDEWSKCGEKFVDKNNMTSEGLIPQSIGVASALLLFVVFGDKKEVFPKNERNENYNKLSKMITTMLNMIEKDGYCIAPYKSAAETKELFGTYGYTDVMTWVASSFFLANYAKRKNILQLEKDLMERFKHFGADAFIKLLKGQREDGTWGFRADGGIMARGSLYFTYAVNAALADFFNYAMGEIDTVENANDSENFVKGSDKEFIKYLDEIAGFDVVKAANDARAKLQDWIIKNALPLLPKVATCRNLSDSDKEILCIGKKKNNSDYEFNYFNLYHTYFLIDMIIDSAADIRYFEIAKNSDSKEFAELKNYYLNAYPSSSDIGYYFRRNNGENAKNFCREYLAQAIHSSRVNYMRASRTGNDFWTAKNGGSEYEIEWNHDEGDYDAHQLIAEVYEKIKEPALVPMALRINVQYSYYVSEQLDKTVDDMFEQIMSDRFDASSDSTHVHDLWDSVSYNLLVTERSIEALIDAYDYVCKYEVDENGKEKSSKSVGEIEEAIQNLVDERVESALKNTSSSVDLQTAVDEAVANALKNANFEDLVAKEVEKRMAGAPACSGEGLSEEELINKIRAVTKFIKDEIPSAKGEQANETLAYETLRLFMEMQKCLDRTTVAKQLFMAGERSRDGNDLFKLEDDRLFRKYADDATDQFSTFERSYPNFFSTLVEDVKNGDANYLLNLYGVLKDLLNQQK